MNNVILVGRLVDEPKEIERKGVKKVLVTLAIKRTYKNINGVCETDFINCILWNAINDSVLSKCTVGGVMGIKGRLESDENKNVYVIADKVSYISSTNKDESEEE